MDNEYTDISGTQSPSSNPFHSVNLSEKASFRNTSFKDVGGPSLAAFNDENDDFFPRESLGILPSTTLIRDSLTSDFFSISSKDQGTMSPRESLGILNISSMDIGRESIGIFSINNPIFKREFSDHDGTETLGYNDLQKTMISSLHQEHSVPHILLSSIGDKTSYSAIGDLDNAFLMPHSRKISGVSSGSSVLSVNPYFNSRSLEEPSKISSAGSLQKGMNPSSTSAMVSTDPFNQAFQYYLGGDLHSISCKSGSTNFTLDNDLENIRNRIQSLPLHFEENKLLGDIDLGNRTENLSFGGLICRGVEGEKELDDSVFLQDGKRIHLDTSFNCEEKSFNGEKYLLDSTPQPDWGDWDSSKSNVEDKEKSPYTTEVISKKVEKMLGMQPINLEEKLKFKNDSKCDSTQSVNMSQNISKISRASQCSILENRSYTSHNFSQDLSKISRTSEENVSRIINDLSEIINEKEDLSKSQRNEGRHMLHCLAGLLRGDNGSKASHSEDSGHSSVEDPQLEDKPGTMESSDGPSNEKVYEVLDLSCKNQSCGSVNLKISNSLSLSKSPSIRNPPPYAVNSPSHVAMNNASTDSRGIHTSVTNTTPGNNSQGNTSNTSNASAKNRSSSSVVSLRRHSNITQNKVSLGAEKIKRSNSGIVVSKKQPLRAVLPVENMAKNTRSINKPAYVPVTPEANKLILKSKKTSTPLQEPKLKPMAASTPATTRLSKDLKENASAKPKYTRSFSYQPRASTTLDQPTSNRKSGESNISRNIVKKSACKIEETNIRTRRNSVTESTLSYKLDNEGMSYPRLKRSFSTGKESKILSALSKVRQNILNSPYYNPRKSADPMDTQVGTSNTDSQGKLEADLKRCGLELKSLTKNNQSKKVGKENVKP